MGELRLPLEVEVAEAKAEVANLNESQRASNAVADAFSEAQERKATDEHVGGRYKLSDDPDAPFVNAEGKEIK